MNIKYIGIALVLSAAGLSAGWNNSLVIAASNGPPTLFAGSVSAGAPLAGGMLFVTDSSTPVRAFTAPILADGSYSLNAAHGEAPFLFKARGRVGSREIELFSASAVKSGRVDVSPLTSLMVANVAGWDCAVTACNPSSFTAVRLAEAAAEVQTQLVPLLTQFALAIADELDPRQGDPASTRKWVYFKHIAVGGYIYSRDGPLEFIKDAATGNWQMAGNRREVTGARLGKHAEIYAPPPGASSFGKWLPFASDSSAHPGGATLIAVSSTSIIPPVTLVYMDGNNGAAKLTGAAMVEAVSGNSFLPACPRSAGKSGSCVEVAQISGGGIYTAKINYLAGLSHRQAINNHLNKSSY